MELKDYLRIIRRRAWTVVLCMLLIVILHMLYIRSKPQYYRSSSQVLIKGMEDFYRIIQGEQQMPLWSELAYTTRLSLIKSEAVLRRAVALMPEDFPELFVKDSITGELKLSGDEGLLGGAIAQLRNTLSIKKVEEEGEIIMLTMEGTNGKFTMRAVNAIAEAYTAFIAEDAVENLLKAKDYVVKRKDELDLKIMEKEKEYKKALDVQKALQPVQDQAFYGDIIAGLQKGIAENMVRRDTLAPEIGQLEEKLAKCAIAINPEFIDNSEIDGLRSQKSEIQKQLLLFQSKYTPNHSMYIQKVAEINTVNEQIATISKEINNRALKKSIDAVVADLEKKRIELKETVSNIEVLKKQVDEHYEKVTAKTPKEEEPVRRISIENDPDLIKFYLDALKQQWMGLNDQFDLLEREWKTNSQMGARVKVISAAKEGFPIPKPGASSWPFAIIIGALVGIGIAYFLEYINTTVRTEYDVRRYVNVPMLGAIIKIKDESQRLLLNVAPKMPIYEVYNTIGALIESYAIEHKSKLMMVASSRAEEGKSTVTSNIAIALANGGQEVIIVDCDLRKAVMHRFFNVDNSVGLTSLILSQEEFAVADQPANVPLLTIKDIIKPTEVAGLKIIPAGPHPQNPVGILKSESYKRFLREVRDMADIVLIDVPPVNLAVDTIILSSLVDAIVLLIAAGQTNKDEVSYAKKLIESARGNIIGCILNKVSLDSKGYYYYYYYYYDTYKYYRET